MNTLLSRIRYLLVAVPAILSIEMIPSGSYAIYTLYVLLALLVVRAATYFSHFAGVLFVIELIGFAWLSYTYGGVLHLLLFSTLIAFIRSTPAKLVSVFYTILGLTALIIALHGRDYEVIITAAVLWIMAAAILYAANGFDDKRHKVEELYEALAASHEELEAARRRMLLYASQIEQYAQTEERNRIAKDIHDDLGHRLIRVKMMSEAALQLFDSDSARAKVMIGQIRDQLQDSMERMRRTVRRLASSDENDTRRYALDRLVQESASSLGIDVSFDIRGMPQPLYPSMELILFKNAQEAITNAVRHGDASVVHVVLEFGADQVELTIANNGSLPGTPVEPGLGMRGMKERIALIGGRLEWRTDDRFSVTTTLPLLGSKSKIRSG